MAVVLFDTETGEIDDKEIYSYTTVKQHEAQTKYSATKSRNSKFSEYGTFVWLVYAPYKELYPLLDDADITRLILLSTYINYDNILCFDNGVKILKKDIVRVLKTSDSSARRFINNMVEQNILKIYDDHIKLNSKTLYKGNLNYNYNTDDETIRVYIECVRSLYYNCNSAGKKKLSYLFKMIPWINKKYNVLCTEINETDSHNLKLMTFGKFCDLIGYDRSHIARLKSDLLSFRFNGKRLVSFMMCEDINKYTVYVSPRLFYSGSDNDVIAILNEHFTENDDDEEAIAHRNKNRGTKTRKIASETI